MKRKYQPHGFAVRLTPAWREYQTRLFAVRAARASGQAKRVVSSARRRTTNQRGAATRSSVESGDGPSDPEPPRPQFSLSYLYTEQTLADLLCVSKKTLQNLYSKTPWLLPPAIKIPGARGPRWTQAAIDEWLSERPRHTPKPAPQPTTKRKVGRPRIAQAVQGVRP